MQSTRNLSSALHYRPNQGSVIAVALLVVVGMLFGISCRFGEPLATGRKPFEGILAGIFGAIQSEQHSDRLLQRGRDRRYQPVPI